MGCLLLWVVRTWFIGKGLNLVSVFLTVCIWWVIPSFKIFLNISKMVYESLKWYSRSGTLSLTLILVLNAPSAYCVGCVCFSLLHLGIESARMGMRMTCDSYLVPHSWITYLCCFFKEKPALMFNTQLSFDFGLFFSHSMSFSSLVMDFKTALTQGSGIVSEPNVPIQGNYVDNSSEELPSIYEEDLACCESFAKLFLIGKVLGESVPLKSISSKMKAE